MNLIIYSIVFCFCFMISARLRSSFGSISSWINVIQSKKMTELLIYRPKWKIHFVICFVHKIKTISLFGLTSGHKRSCDYIMRSTIFGGKISARPQRKKQIMKRRGWKRGSLACAATFDKFLFWIVSQTFGKFPWMTNIFFCHMTHTQMKIFYAWLSTDHVCKGYDIRLCSNSILVGAPLRLDYAMASWNKSCTFIVLSYKLL